MKKDDTLVGELPHPLTQCCQNFRAPNRGKLAFLPAASDFKVAQFLSSNHTPNFPNLGAFQP